MDHIDTVGRTFVAVNETGWDDAWNKPDRELTQEEREALQAHCDQQMWDARLSRDLTKYRPVGDASGYEPQSIEPEEEKVPSWGLTILLYISPFIFLAVLAFVLVLLGARPN